jgi:hypothetical protein
MKVRVKSIEEIRKIGIGTYPSFIISDNFDDHEFASHHSMEYYCGKVIELEENNRFGGWLWDNWMYDTVPETPLLEVEE